MDVSDTPIGEQIEQIAGTSTFWSEAPAQTDSPVLYIHGVPTSSRDWIPFLERTGGVAIDLPGFGRSEKPHTFDYSIGGYNAFLQAFIGKLEWERFSIVVHDWGALALVTAQELCDRIDRLVVINAVPLLPGYKWHLIAQAWRLPLVGELAMGLSAKTLLHAAIKRGQPGRKPWPKQMIDDAWNDFDHGTQRAILKLYRSAPPRVLEQAGERLGMIDAQSLVIWGAQDPYIGVENAQEYGERLANSHVKVLADAGHWPWLERPDVIDQVTDFLISRNNPA